jgi:tetratricopeptide (TPR) repeat protein
VYLANFGLLLLLVLLYDRAKVGLLGAAKRPALAFAALHLCVLLGVSLHRNRVFATQEGIWSEILSVYPDSFRGALGLANTYIMEKRLEEAKGVLEKLRSQYPGEAQVAINLGRAYGLLDENEKALAEIQRVIQINPRYLDAYTLAGTFLIRLGRLAEAEQVLRRSLSLDPAQANPHLELADIYHAQGKSQEEGQELELARRIDPNVR